MESGHRHTQGEKCPMKIKAEIRAMFLTERNASKPPEGRRDVWNVIFTASEGIHPTDTLILDFPPPELRR